MEKYGRMGEIPLPETCKHKCYPLCYQQTSETTVFNNSDNRTVLCSTCFAFEFPNKAVIVDVVLRYSTLRVIGVCIYTFFFL